MGQLQAWGRESESARQCLAEHLLDVPGQHFKLGHIVIDHEDRELGDLIRPGAEPSSAVRKFA
jgi:hypothetical protein